MPRSKNSPNLSAIHLSEIHAQIAALQAQADALRKKELAGVVARVKVAIAQFGLTAKDLGFGSAAHKSGLPADANGSTAMKKPRQLKGAKSKVRKVKFKDHQGNTWGGMGKRPDWFKAALAAGKTPGDLLA
jgi:DNA-binding protein H-NS